MSYDRLGLIAYVVNWSLESVSVVKGECTEHGVRSNV